MANSPYDDSDDPLRSPKFNRAIRQAEEKGLKRGFDFEGFYIRPIEKGPLREVGWDCEGEKVRLNCLDLAKKISYCVATDCIDHNSRKWKPRRQLCSREDFDRLFSDNGDKDCYEYIGEQGSLRQLSFREDLDRYLDDDCDGFIDEGFEHNRRIYGIERL